MNHTATINRPPASQPRSRALAQALDSADIKNRTTFQALEAARIAFAETCEPLKLARSAYRARVRAEAAKRSVPRLPAGTGDDAKAIVAAARDARDAAAKLFFDLSSLDLDDREQIDAAAEYEAADRIYGVLCETFNARGAKQFERDSTVQGRVMNFNMIEAAISRGVQVKFLGRRKPTGAQ